MPTGRGAHLNIRRLALDVDKTIDRPDVVAIAEAVTAVPGVAATNITVTEIDLETVGMDVTVEGEGIDHRALIKAIEATGAVVHSVDEVVAGDHLIERVPRER
jgi:hypothetical protein